jgi:outer membrane murein-binding lipoprotein Lpp
VIKSLQTSLDLATLSLGAFQTEMQRDIDGQLAGLRHEMGGTVEKLTADVAAMKSQFDSAVARLDASHEKLSLTGKRLEPAESAARMDALAAEIEI